MSVEGALKSAKMSCCSSSWGAVRNWLPFHADILPEGGVCNHTLKYLQARSEFTRRYLSIALPLLQTSLAIRLPPVVVLERCPFTVSEIGT